MRKLEIRSTDSWNSVDLTCTNEPCSKKYHEPSGPILVCGENLENECYFEPKSNGTWKCIDEGNICDDLSTHSPTQSPTIMPTYNRNEEPPHTLYVSASNGCDYGWCQTNKFEKSEFCKYESSKCCNDFTQTSKLEQTTNCSTNNTVIITKYGAHTNTVSGNISVLPSWYDDDFFKGDYNYYEKINREYGLGLTEVACFDIAANLSCWKPTVKEILFEDIDYCAPFWYSLYWQSYQEFYYLYSAYQTIENKITSECKSDTETNCGVYRQCPVENQLNDFMWSYGNGPYAFYFWVLRNCDGNNMNAKITVECNRLETECQSFEYVWNCMHGLNECADSEYDGNGKIVMDEGEYFMDQAIEIDYNYVILKGNGKKKTMFQHSSSSESLIVCTHWCHLILSHLSYSITASSSIVQNGGFLRFESVHFENNHALTFVIENNASIEFLDCSFVSSTVNWQISNEANAYFDDCLFDDLSIGNVAESLIEVSRDSVVHFSNSEFSEIHKVCYLQNVCNDGYMDSTRGTGKYTACGGECIGLRHYTDEECNCACIPVKSCAKYSYTLHPTPNPTQPTADPTANPTKTPTVSPTSDPTEYKPCFPQGPCKEGYMDSTNGNANYWIKCGSECIGGPYRTDEECNCACILETNQCSTSHPTISPTQHPAEPTMSPTSSPTQAPAFQQQALILKSLNSFGNITNTLNDCNDICIEHIDGDLFIDFTSAQNKNVKIGHSNSSSSPVITTQSNNLSQPIPQPAKLFSLYRLYASNFVPETVWEYFVFEGFDVDQFRLIFEPCELFDSEYVEQTLILFEQASNGLNATNIFDKRSDLFKDYQLCNQSDICYVKCYEEELVCPQSTFKSNISNIALFQCGSESACDQSIIDVSNAESVSILCNNITACEQLEIIVEETNEFILECVEFESCKDVTLNIVQTHNVSIHCYMKRSCDGLRVHSDKNEIKISIHSFSSNIRVNVPSNYLDDSLNCNPNSAYLRLDGMTFNNLEQETKQLFDGNMPCEDVTFSFDNSEKADCIVEYEYFSNEQIDERLSHLTDEMECFPPIYIDDFSNHFCFGTADPTTNPTTDPTAPSQAPTTAPSRAPTSLSDYDAFINAKYNLFNVQFADILVMADDNDFDQSWLEMVRMMESAYVNHQSNWKLHFYDFFVEIRTINKLKQAQIANAHRSDLEIYETCDYKQPCLLQFDCKINCVESVCQYMLQKYDKKLFERMMTHKFENYFVYSQNESNSIRFEVASMSEMQLDDPPEWWQRLGWFEEEWIYYLLMASFAMIVCGFILVVTYYYKTKSRRERQSKAMYVENAMVLLVSIGKYIKNKSRRKNDINGQMNDLVGIENDTLHMTELFGEKLGYDVYPRMNYNDGVRVIWNERDFKEFIEERARYLLNNIDDGKKYDSLVLIISCHGIPDYLIMSDYRKYSKLAVQRTFSFWPKLREIPRFILYDCCSGDQSREDEKVKDEDNMKEKKVDENDIFDGAEKHKYWVGDDQNPDHKLARVNAANAGFTSNLNTLTGSHLIFKMYNKYMDALDGKRTPFPFIHEVFDEIQYELQEEGKQLPESVWNDKTRYLIFKKRNGPTTSTPTSDVVELESLLDDSDEDNSQNSIRV